MSSSVPGRSCTMSLFDDISVLIALRTPAGGPPAEAAWQDTGKREIVVVVAGRPPGGPLSHEGLLISPPGTEDC